jgi:hypothetical protein
MPGKIRYVHSMLADHDAPSPIPQLWSLKKILFWFLGSFLTVIIFILAYDEKLEPYDDLLPMRTTTPDARTNGYVYLKERWEKVPELSRTEKQTALDMLSGRIPWDSEFVAKLQVGWEHLPEDLRAALALPEYQIPVALSYADLPSSSMSWITQVGRRLNLAALHKARSGDVAGALALTGSLHELSQRYIKGSGSIQHDYARADQ